MQARRTLKGLLRRTGAEIWPQALGPGQCPAQRGRRGEAKLEVGLAAPGGPLMGLSGETCQGEAGEEKQAQRAAEAKTGKLNIPNLRNYAVCHSIPCSSFSAIPPPKVFTPSTHLGPEVLTHTAPKGTLRTGRTSTGAAQVEGLAAVAGEVAVAADAAVAGAGGGDAHRRGTGLLGGDVM